MAYLFIIAPILFQITFVIHAVRNGKVFPWIYIIMFLPGVGAAAYFFMEMLPDIMNGRQARKATENIREKINPGRALKEAHRDVFMSGSVDSRRALAEQYMKRREYVSAVETYQEAMKGHFANDVALLQGLAKAQFMAGDGTGTQATLDALQATDPTFVSADMHLLYARALEMQGRDDEALAEYPSMVRYYSGEEARARYGLLLKKVGRVDEARSQFEEILRLMDGAPSHYIRAQKEWRDIAQQNLR